MNTSTPPRPEPWPPLRDLVQRIENDARQDRKILEAQGAVRRRITGRSRDILRGRGLGHAVHPMATDLPIGCWTASALLDVTGPRAFSRASRRLVALGLLAVPLAAASGAADWSEVDRPAARRVGAAHGVGNSAVAIVYFLSWRARRRGHLVRGILLGLVGAAGASFTGYLGGHLSSNLGVGVGDRGMRTRPSIPAVTPFATPDDNVEVDLGDSMPVGAGPVDDWAGLD